MKNKIAAPKLPRAPTMSRSAAALRLGTINDNHVQRHKAHHGRVLFAKRVAENTARNNHNLEYNAILGASLHCILSGYAIDKLGALQTYLHTYI